MTIHCVFRVASRWEYKKKNSRLDDYSRESVYAFDANFQKRNSQTRRDLYGEKETTRLLGNPSPLIKLLNEVRKKGSGINDF